METFLDYKMISFFITQFLDYNLANVGFSPLVAWAITAVIKSSDCNSSAFISL